MNLSHVIAEREHKTIYRDGNETIKLFDETYPISFILNEALNLARAQETGLPVPALHKVTKVDNRWAIVTEYVEGKTITQLMDENPDKIQQYMDLFVTIQTDIHKHRCPMLTKHEDKMHTKISSTTLSATARYDLHTRLNALPKHNKVLHGDYTTSNVIIMPDGDYRVIDWAHATQGNASADAARTYLRFYLAGQEDRAEIYLKTFCLHTDTALQYVQKWIPIVAASQSVKGKPEEREFLLRWVNVMDYE